METLPWDKNTKILIIGCGNSSLGFDLMSQGGFTNIDNMDYSEVVIEKMKEKHPDMRWHAMDMMAMTFPDGDFDCVLDKGTMDVIMTDNKDPWNPTEEVKERGRKVIDNVYRVLKPGGQFIQISFDQPHFRKKFILPEHIQWAEFK